MKSSKASQASSKPSRVMKWVGYGTAILSLAAGIGGIGRTVLNRLEIPASGHSQAVVTYGGGGGGSSRAGSSAGYAGR